MQLLWQGGLTLPVGLHLQIESHCFKHLHYHLLPKHENNYPIFLWSRVCLANVFLKHLDFLITYQFWKALLQFSMSSSLSKFLFRLHYCQGVSFPFSFPFLFFLIMRKMVWWSYNFSTIFQLLTRSAEPMSESLLFFCLKTPSRDPQPPILTWSNSVLSQLYGFWLVIFVTPGFCFFISHLCFLFCFVLFWSGFYWLLLLCYFGFHLHSLILDAVFALRLGWYCVLGPHSLFAHSVLKSHQEAQQQIEKERHPEAEVIAYKCPTASNPRMQWDSLAPQCCINAAQRIEGWEMRLEVGWGPIYHPRDLVVALQWKGTSE
jgi:hypothetical protein